MKEKRALQTLPEGYQEFFTVDLQKNKKMAIGLNLAALFIAVIMVVPVHFYIIPLSSFLDMSKGMGVYWLRLVIFLAGTVGYMVLHELVHGITMKYFGTKKVKYGFTGMCAYAGSEDYYDKKSYIAIALAPVVVWGVVLGIACFLVPYEWFWMVYFLQIFNISGAAGDLYVTAKFSRMPKDILIRDYGVGMTVYSLNQE